MVRKNVALSIGVVSLVSGAGLAQQITTTWLGPNGMSTDAWSDGGSWSNGVPLNSGATTYFAIINASAADPVLRDTSTLVDRVAMGPSSALTIGNGRLLSIVAEPDPDAPSGLTGLLGMDDAMVLVEGAGFSTGIRVQGVGTLTLGALPADGSEAPSGQITLSDNVSNAIQGDASPDQTLLIAPNTQISGAGSIGADSASVFNTGLIQASGTEALTLNAGDGDNLTNQGVIQAINGAELRIEDSVVDNAMGVIRAQSGSLVDIRSVSTVIGGRLETEGDGVVLLNASTIIDGVSMAPGSNIQQGNADQVTIRNGVRNDALWTISGITTLTRATFDGSQAIEGFGELVMIEGSSNRISATNESDIITNGASHTIRGSGTLLIDVGGFVNLGAIIAQGADRVNIDPGDASSFVNLGQMRASGSGGFNFRGGLYENTGSTIVIEDGSLLLMDTGARVRGGSIQTQGSGFVLPVSGAIFDQVTIDTGSVVAQENSVSVIVDNHVVNDGTWNVNSTGVLTEIELDGVDPSILGAGSIILSNDPDNRIQTIQTGGTLTHGAGHTIRGAGTLLANRSGLINQGTIIAQGSWPLAIDPSPDSPFQNTGVLRAEGTGGLRLEAGAYEMNGTTIQIESGSELEVMTSAVINDAVIESGAGAEIIVQTGAVFNNVTTSEGTTIAVLNARQPDIVGTLVNNGVWALQGDQTTTTIELIGSVVIEGSGEIVGSDFGANRILSFEAGTLLTHGPDHTMRGAFRLLDGNGGMINLGTIKAQGAQPIEIRPELGMNFDNTPSGVLTGGQGGGGFVFFNLTDNAGIIAPGDGIGALTIDAFNVTNQPTANLIIEIGGDPVSGAFDVLNVTGTYQAGGQITINLVDGYEPTRSGPYAVLTTSALSGAFSNALPTGSVATGIVTGNARFDLTYDQVNGELIVSNLTASESPCSVADLAFPFGVLDFADLLAFLNAFGAMDSAADLADPIGVFDFADVIAFLGVFAAGCP